MGKKGILGLRGILGNSPWFPCALTSVSTFLMTLSSNACFIPNKMTNFVSYGLHQGQSYRLIRTTIPKVKSGAAQLKNKFPLGPPNPKPSC